MPAKCSFSGRLYLSTVRVVLVSQRDNPLRAFDMPLVRCLEAVAAHVSSAR